MNYSDFDLQDFLNDDAFVQWVLFGTEDYFWRQVLEDNPALKDVIGKAREIIGQLNREEEKRAIALDEDQILRQIQRKIEESDSAFEWPVEHPAKKNWLKWAAVILCFCGAGWLLLNGRVIRPTNYKDLVAKAEKHNPLVESVNTSEKPMKVLLEDGTVVTLKKNSRISYPAHFKSDIRETYLSGEAFFEVARNPEKPFFVYANELVTKVLGTSFVVKAFDGERQVRVNVRTGSVSVYNHKQTGLVDEETKELVLSPNQQAVFDRKNESLSKRLADDPRPLTAQDGDQKKRFEEVPVSVVLQELEQVYGIKIIYNKEVLSNCIISTLFGKESLNDKLDVVCQTIGASHKETDAQIIIESTGCSP